MRQAPSKKDDLMEVIADLGLVVWCFITLFSFSSFGFSFLSGAPDDAGLPDAQLSAPTGNCAPSFPAPPLLSAGCL